MLLALLASSRPGLLASRPSRAPTIVASEAPPLQAVLFDIDGTLFDSDGLHFEAWREALLETEVGEIDEQFFLSSISGRQNAIICEELFPAWSTAQGEAFAERKEQRFRDLAAAKLPSLTTPGLAALCERLERAGTRQAAVTNAPRANAELMLAAIGRLDAFDRGLGKSCLIIGDECERAKPDPEPYIEAMRRLGVPPEGCIAFEDSPAGASAAVAAGVRTIGITSTRSEAELVAAGCGLAIRDFEDERLEAELTVRWRGL